ncbi:TPA: transglycosylase SLT domain-containing protein, partial [Enterococcus faecium]
YDHVHLNGVKDPQNTQISGDSVGGSGVERWRNVAIRALKMTGQYSTANLNALLNQMRTESNGNPNAVNNWDINAKNGTPSKGLLQVIDPTFRQYAMPGFNSNIFDPLSNILASIRYALSRYGSLTNAYRGVGYANGGIVNQHQIAEIAEG